MEFKFNSTVFKNTAEDHKRLYGDKYDPNKPYPDFTGNISIPKRKSCRLLSNTCIGLFALS